jgi:hypothetical protein
MMSADAALLLRLGTSGSGAGRFRDHSLERRLDAARKNDDRKLRFGREAARHAAQQHGAPRPVAT